MTLTRARVWQCDTLVTGGDTLATMKYRSKVVRVRVMTLVARVTSEAMVSSTIDRGEGDTDPVRIHSSGIVMVTTTSSMSAVDKQDSQILDWMEIGRAHV